MNTREKVYSEIEKEIKKRISPGTLIIPSFLMGNIVEGEIENYLLIKGYKVESKDKDDSEVHFHYKLRGIEYA